MKYTMEERLDIGRRIYEGEIGRYQAAVEYGIHEHTARTYIMVSLSWFSWYHLCWKWLRPSTFIF